MLYLLYGADEKTAREKCAALVSALLQKKPDAHHVRITSDIYAGAILDEHIAAQGLFERKYVVVCERLLGEKEITKDILGRLSALQASENIFIFFEGELEGTVVCEIEKYAQKIQEFTKPSTSSRGKQAFNIFSLTDAFGRRDRKSAWTLYQKGVLGGVAPEEMHAMLVWQIKNILLSHDVKRAAEAGLAPFVFNKSKMFAKNFSRDELHAHMQALVLSYHDDRRSRGDMAIALERQLLSL